MKFYIDTIEQVKGVEEGTLVEYGKREKYDTEQSALVKFYQTLSNVSASSQHIYMDIKIVNSEGGCIKKDVVGVYQTETNEAE